MANNSNRNYQTDEHNRNSNRTSSAQNRNGMDKNCTERNKNRTSSKNKNSYDETENY